MNLFIIDDDPVSAFITERKVVLEGFSTSVRTFLSAGDALDTLLEDFPVNVPDLIFLDLNMPQISGWQLLDALAPYQEPLKNSCSIYILTSSLNLADTARARDHHLVTGFIHKPLTEEDLKVIRAELNGTD